MFEDIQEVAEKIGPGTTVYPTKSRATDAKIRALEKAFAVTFPADYKLFLKRFGSLHFAVDEALWPRPQIGAIGPYWKMTCYELSAFGLCAEAEWMRIDVETKRFRAETGTDLTPVLGFGNTSDRVCLRPDGKLVLWLDGEVIAMKTSFAKALAAHVAEQRAYKEELIAGPKRAATKRTATKPAATKRTATKRKATKQPARKSKPAPRRARVRAT